jgi:hypothetical protein
MSDYEELFLEQYEQMGFQSEEYTRIENIDFKFKKMQSSSLNYSWIDDETLKLSIKNQSAEEGIKHALAQLVYDFKGNLCFPDIRQGFVPAVVPLAMLILPLILLDETKRSLMLSVLAGPVLYCVITIPFLLWLTKKRMEDEELVRETTRKHLQKATIYSDNEAEEWIDFVTRCRVLYYMVDYLTFIPSLIIINWLVFFVI